MSTTPHAAAAGAARQRIAASLGTLQQDPNVPPAVLEVVAGLAKAMGPLFQLERGSQDMQLFGQARGVLQETLAKMQTVDQGYPGVADATAAIAASLGTIFQAMREAGMVPQAPGAQPATGGPVRRPTPPPAPAVSPPAASQSFPLVSQGASPAASPTAPRAGAPIVKGYPPPAPNDPNPTGTARSSPGMQAAAPFPLRAAAGGVPSAGAHGAGAAGAGAAGAAGGTVPLGPHGAPRLEAEIGVHSETNFFTDFLGDIRNHGGIFIATFHVLAIGTTCDVVLTFPGNLTAELRGVVKWKRENTAANVSAQASPGLGIEITNAPPEAWNLIDRFMRKREPIMHEM